MVEFNGWYQTLARSRGAYHHMAERAYGVGQYIGQQGLSTRAHIAQLASMSIPQGATRVLDACCGDGGVLRELQSLFSGHLVGIDLSEHGVQQARAKVGDGISVVVSDAERLPFGTATFDAVLFIDSLASMNAPGVVFQELGRIVVGGGRLGLTAEVGAPLSVAEQARFTRSEAPTVVTRADLVELLRGAGLDVVVTTDTTPEVTRVATQLVTALEHDDGSVRAELGEGATRDQIATLGTLAEMFGSGRLCELSVVAQRMTRP